MTPKLIGRAVLLTLLGALLLSAPSSASAKTWDVDYPNSHLNFVGTQGNSAFTGTFKKFQAAIDFDPDHLDTSKIRITIDTASATAGSDERDSYLPQADWFDTAKFPQAVFESTKITKTTGDNYTADGTLTIKGISRPVTLTFLLTPGQNSWRAQGQTDLVRTNFHIGEGQWDNETYVKFPVQVQFDITATPQS